MPISLEKPYVVVWGGHKLYFLEPKPTDYDPIRVANALAREVRFAGNYGGTYCVAQHSVLVSQAVEQAGGNARQALAGLVHDAAEIVTGDLPSPLKKYMSGYAYLEALQNTAIEARYGVDLDDELVKRCDRMVLSAEVRMLVPVPDQHLFAVDTEYFRDEQPGWLQILPWTHSEVIAHFMDRYDQLWEELSGVGRGEN